MCDVKETFTKFLLTLLTSLPSRLIFQAMEVSALTRSVQSLSSVLNQLKESPRLGGKAEEYQLVGKPACLQQIIDFLHGGNQVIWTTQNACIYRQAEIEVPAGFDPQEGKVLFQYNKNGNMKFALLRFLAATPADKVNCFEFLIRQSDTHYDEIRISSTTPVTPRVLKILLERKPGPGRFVFYHKVFSPDCGRVLATFGNRTHLRFLDCRFEDGGETFVNALSRRRDDKVGPSEVWLQGIELLLRPENRHKLFRSLQQTALQNFSLTLDASRLDEEDSQLLAMTNIQMLQIANVEMADRGERLATSIRRGHCPRGLHIGKSPHIGNFREIDLVMLRNILNAVGDERCLVEKLIVEDHTDVALLAAALKGNKSLCHLELRGLIMKMHFWRKVLLAISTHPTLRTLHFSYIETTLDDDDLLQEGTKQRRTEQVAVMLTTNHLVTEMDLCSATLDRTTWDNRVAPLLECNQYRAKVPSLWKVEPESTRASLLSLCMARVCMNPSTLYLLLSNNQGLIASYAVN